MTSPRLGDPLFPGVEDTRWPARVSTFWAESAPSPQKSPEIPKSEFSWLTRPFFHPVSTLFINMYKRTTEKVPAQSVQILKSDFRTVMHQLEPPSVCRASLRLPSLAGKIRHPIYSPLLIFMALANPVLFVLCVATRRTRPRLRKDSD